MTDFLAALAFAAVVCVAAGLPTGMFARRGDTWWPPAEPKPEPEPQPQPTGSAT